MKINVRLANGQRVPQIIENMTEVDSFMYKENVSFFNA